MIFDSVMSVLEVLPDWARMVLAVLAGFVAMFCILLIGMPLISLPVGLGIGLLLGQSIAEATAAWWDIAKMIVVFTGGLMVMATPLYVFAITASGWSVESEENRWGPRWKPLRLILAILSFFGSLYVIYGVLDAL